MILYCYDKKCQCKVILGRGVVGTFGCMCVRVKNVGLNKTVKLIFLFLKTT